MLRRILVLAILSLAAAAQAQPAATAPATGNSLRPVPPADQQNQSQATFHKIFAAEFAQTSAADRQALARLLLAQGQAAKDDAVAQYVALVDAVDLATGAGDASTAIGAVDALAVRFNVDRVQLRRAALQRAAATASGEADFQALVRLALETADFAADADTFDGVEEMVTLAESAANKSHQMNLVASIQIHLADLRDMALEYAGVKAALTRLERTPDDAQAHLTVGRYYTLTKGQWVLGLPHLAKGSNVELAALATRELANPQDGAQQTLLADGWWDVAQAQTGKQKQVTMAHAARWYAAAQESLKTITQARIAARLDQAAAANAPTSGIGAGTALLPLIDVTRDAAVGEWTRSPAGITCAAGPYACLQIPYFPAEEYDLTTSFTRTQGDGSIAILLAAQKRAFEFVLDIKNEARFERVNNKLAQDNPTVVPVAISNGKQYTLTLQVRSDHVRAILDGKLLCEYKTDLKDLSHNTAWKLGDNTLCGIGANNAQVTFHSLDMTEFKGQGKPTR